jgi:hypothetical protein
MLPDLSELTSSNCASLSNVVPNIYPFLAHIIWTLDGFFWPCFRSGHRHSCRIKMAARNDDSLLFVVEWFDPLPMMKKQYLLKFFVDQHMVEMVDLKSRKMFLRKSACPNELTRADFFVGSKILLYSRELEIVDYGDLKTKEQLHQQIQQVVALLPPDAYNNWGKAIQKLNGDLAIIKLKTVLLSPNLADRVCNVLNLSQRTSGALSNGVSLVAVFQGEDAYNKAEQAAASLGRIN